ncbi:tetratricopeptide repeat protein [Pseudoalteromonas fenneropenaei]|uniref:Tetratricopeptide repeat protein n=1 Tax=Pseudoalteromonas fenneropenaei TaxID=1737459 RepID=A0ABV7CI45_9GAMM
MSFIFVVTFALFAVLVRATPAPDTARSASDMLREAEDYINVEPSRSFDLLHQAVDLSTLQSSQQIRWYLARMRAAVATNKLSEVDKDIVRLFTFKAEEYFLQNAGEAFRITGVILRKLGYWQQAQQSFACALQFTTTPNERMGLLINKAILERHLDNDAQARRHYQEAEKIAEELKIERAIAVINNNLGTLELDQGHIEQAEAYYRKALVGFQFSAKRTGNITAGTNLLLIFVIKNEVLNFQRLFDPINTYVENFPDESKKALMQWLIAADQVNRGEALDDASKQQLQQAFTRLESVKLQGLIQTYLAPKLGLSVTPAKKPPERNLPELPWFANLADCFKVAEQFK